MDPAMSAKYSSRAADYPEVTQRAILEMHRQVGVLALNRQGIALRGLMIRHLVMPNRVAGTRQFVIWVAGNLPKSTYVNIMAQYRVEYEAYEYPEIARGITPQEFVEAMAWAEKAGLSNLDPQSVQVWKVYRNR
jgi:putative pyruvate formate lyase activating enzyme